MRAWRFGMMAALMLAGAPAQAVEIEGVQVPEQVVVAGKTLRLNGAGVRTKFFFDIYVGALWLPEPTREAARALAMPGPKRVRMDFLYSEVDKEKLAHGWRKGFERNLSKAEFARMQPRLARFSALFPDMRRGQQVVLDMIPGQGVRVAIDGHEVGLIEGDDFARALLAVWLGGHPADEDLKAAMLAGGMPAE